jgi:hypothetical protein
MPGALAHSRAGSHIHRLHGGSGSSHPPAQNQMNDGEITNNHERHKIYQHKKHYSVDIFCGRVRLVLDPGTSIHIPAHLIVWEPFWFYAKMCISTLHLYTWHYEGWGLVRVESLSIKSFEFESCFSTYVVVATCLFGWWCVLAICVGGCALLAVAAASLRECASPASAARHVQCFVSFCICRSASVW